MIRFQEAYMNSLKIYAFADEASSRIDNQIAAMQRNQLNGLEIRNVDGQSISDISEDKAHEVRHKLDDAGLAVWSLGSPIGKIGIDNENFPGHLDKLRHSLVLADILGAQNIRMFSFYVPENDPEGYRNKVRDRIGMMLEAAEGSGITLCHENEKGIYGSNASRCLELLDTFPEMAGIFDPANFIQCGQETWEAWNLLKHRVKYLHIKDALANGSVVPAGNGIGHLKQILDEYRSMNGNAVTIEPHLTVFDGLKELEQTGNKTKPDAFCYASSDIAFDAACDALKALL